MSDVKRQIEQWSVAMREMFIAFDATTKHAESILGEPHDTAAHDWIVVAVERMRDIRARVADARLTVDHILAVAPDGRLTIRQAQKPVVYYGTDSVDNALKLIMSGQHDACIEMLTRLSKRI